MTRRSVLTVAVSVPLTLTVLAGCGGTAAPQATVTLPRNVKLPPSPGATPPQTLPVKAVTLAPGQTLAVRYESGDAGVQWTQTASGDSKVLGQATATDSSCSSASAGCQENATTTYTAQADGTTTVQWSYIFRGNCPAARKPCAVEIQPIHVTVKQ